MTQLAEDFQKGRPYCAAGFVGNRFYLALRPAERFLKFQATSGTMDHIDEQIRTALRQALIPRRIIDRLVDGAKDGSSNTHSD